MVPPTSRRVFVWSLSTIFLLGFLWYKRKKSSLRSDPGGTNTKIRVEKDCDLSVKKSAGAISGVQNLHSGNSIIEVEVGKTKTTCLASAINENILQGPQIIEETPIEASSSRVEGTAKSSDRSLSQDWNKERCESGIVEENIQDSSFSVTSVVIVEEENKTGSGIHDEGGCNSEGNEFGNSSAAVKTTPKEVTTISPTITKVLEELCEQKTVSHTGATVKVELKNKSVGKVKDVPTVHNSCLNPNAADFILSTIQDFACEHDYHNKKLVAQKFEDIAQSCDFECDKISQVKLITGKVSNCQLNSTSTAVNISTIVDEGRGFQALSTCNIEGGDRNQNPLQVVQTLQDNKEVCSNNSEPTVLEQETGLSCKQSWATEVELELKEENVDSTLEPEDCASKVTEMARESGSDIACKSPAIDDNNPERKSLSLESKLSALQLEESAGKKTAEGGKERHGIERDSANHSPAEVMLESPSISNYSDAQSEGSSDSGKGGSDVATPPSRTPASGSSVAGDLPLPSVFEFVLPQFLVGRLIGRHGIFVHQIKAKTNANIFIKRHPETAKMKICAIEGTVMDIESALDMIRQKFPLKRYPNVTLEQVSFLPPATAFPLGTDSFMVQLIEGVNNDVIVSSLVTPAHFFLQQPTHPTYPALNRLNVCMNICYNEPTAPVLPSPVAADVVCVAPAMGGWFRAQVVSTDPESGTCDVRFMDYGGYLSVEYSALRQIRQDFLTLPFQAAECYLANVKPTNGIWTQEAIAYVEELTHGQVIQAQIYGYAENGVPAIYLFSIQGSEVVVVNQELVSRGYAEFEEPVGETVSPAVNSQVLTAV